MKNLKIYTFANPAILILRFYYKENSHEYVQRINSSYI